MVIHSYFIIENIHQLTITDNHWMDYYGWVEIPRCTCCQNATRGRKQDLLLCQCGRGKTISTSLINAWLQYMRCRTNSVEDTILQLLYSSSAPPTIEMSLKEPGRVVRITADSHWCAISSRIRCLNKGEAHKQVIKWLFNLHQISSCLYLQCDNPLTTF